MKRDREWSNSDLADVLGCGEGTVRNRLADDDPANQMPVHELRRLIAAGEGSTVNAILADLGVHIEPDHFGNPTDALQAAAAASRCSVALIEAAPDGIDGKEWAALLPLLEDEERKISALLAEGRRMLAEGRQ
ncbi:hypothetical protein [Sphingosinithalassobacter portus]|uniref:hypothetical protein n=1 Tax=Stakelama portus TaxID=2676234 RepID=UPI0011AB44CE|nr:hypothetical protein [Sphingosinithalassobacter portus]